MWVIICSHFSLIGNTLFPCTLTDRYCVSWLECEIQTHCLLKAKRGMWTYWPPYQKPTQLEWSIIPRLVFIAQFIFVMKRCSAVGFPSIVLAAAAPTSSGEGVLR